jgi:hypothetical protein
MSSPPEGRPKEEEATEKKEGGKEEDRTEEDGKEVDGKCGSVEERAQLRREGNEESHEEGGQGANPFSEEREENLIRENSNEGVGKSDDGTNQIMSKSFSVGREISIDITSEVGGSWKARSSMLFAPKSKEDEAKELEDLRQWVAAAARERNELAVLEKFDSLTESMSARIAHLEFRVESLLAKQRQPQRPPSVMTSSPFEHRPPSTGLFSATMSSAAMRSRKGSVTENDIAVSVPQRARSNSIVEGIENMVSKPSLPFKRRRSTVKDDEERVIHSETQSPSDEVLNASENKGKSRGKKKEKAALTGFYTLAPYNPGDSDGSTARPVSPRSPSTQARSDSRSHEKVDLFPLNFYRFF